MMGRSRLAALFALVGVLSVGTVASAEASPLAKAEALKQNILDRVRAAAAPFLDATTPKDASANPVATGSVEPGDIGRVSAPSLGVDAAISGAHTDETLRLALTPLGTGALVSAESETGGVVASVPVDISAETSAGTDVTQFPPTFDVETSPDSGVQVATNVQPGVAVTLDVDEARLKRAGVDLSSLTAYTREGPGEPWVALPSYFDASRGTVKAVSTHLSEFVVIGTPVVTSKRPVIVLDPDNDLAWASSPGARVTEGPFNDALATQVKSLLESQCLAKVVVTGSAMDNLDSAFRANIAAAANPEVTVTIGFNSLSGSAWGSSSDGGSHVYSRGNSPDDALTAQLVSELPSWTGRPATQKPTTANLPHAPLASLPGAVAHLETLFMDHNLDRPVIDTGFSSIATGVAKSIGNYLEASGGGFNCTNPVLGGWPAKPSQAQLDQWRKLGYQNYLTYGGDPVSYSTGNLVESEPLFSLAGAAGSSLDVSLTYNSLDGRLGRVGAGWNFGLGGRAQIFDDGSVMVVRGDGASFVFAPNGSGGFTPDTTAHLTLTNLGGNILRMASTTTGEQWTYDAADIDGIGELTSYTNRNGQRFTLTYAAADPDVHQFVPLTRITDASGQVVQVGNDSQGRITSFTLPDGRVWRLVYDGAGNLVRITDAANRSRTFTYDGAHRILTMTDAAGVTYLRNAYDASGRVTSQWDAENSLRTFDYQANQTAYTDQLGRQTTYGFDALGRITQIVDPAGRTQRWTFDSANNVTQYVDGSGRITRYTYDADGNALTVTDPSSATTTYTYTPTGRVASKTDALGRTTTFQYDGHGTLTRVVRPDGRSITYGVDSAGNITSMSLPSGATTTYTVDAHGNRTSETDPLGRVTRYTFDASNRLVSRIDPLGHTTTFAWTANNRVASTTDPLGRVTQFGYDANGNLASTTDPAGNVTTYSWDSLFRIVNVTNAAGGSTSYRYDSEDQLTGVTDAAGRQTTFVLDVLGRISDVHDPAGGSWQRSYDSAGNLVRQTDPSGALSSATYDALDRQTSATGPTGLFVRTSFDAVGRIVSTTDGAGNTTRTSYDVLDQVTAVTDAAGNRTEYRYDIDGNLVGVIDRLGNPILFVVDAAGQVTSRTDANGAVTTYGYDAVGNLTSVTDALGHVTRASYDAAHQQMSLTDELGAVTSFSYDAAGNLSSVTDATGATTRYTWTTLGQVASETDDVGAVTHFSYDAAGQLVQRIDPLGHATSYSYGPLGGVMSVTHAAGNVTRYSYDALGSLASVTDARGNTTSYRNNAVGQVVEETDAAGASTSIEYNNVGLAKRIITPTGASISFTYTQLGDMATQSSASGTVGFEYDAEQRLIAASNPTGAIGWTYTPTGQVASQIDARGSELKYSYDALGQLSSLGLPGGKQIGYTRDAAGRVSTLTSPWGSASYQRDALGRATRTTRSNQVTTDTSFDAVGRVTQLTKSTPGTPTPTATPSSPSRSEGCPVVTAQNARSLRAANVDRAGCVKVSTYLAKRSLPVASALPTGTSLSESTAYDLAGNVTSRTRTASVPDASASSGVRVVDRVASTYSYDALDRLTGSVSSTGESNEYGYDAVGNRTSWTHTAATATSGVLDPVIPGSAPGTSIAGAPAGASTAAGTVAATDASFTQSQSFNALNQLASSRVDDGQATSYRYDAAGQRTSMTGPSGSRSYGWNELGQLTSVTGGDVSSRYSYDALGRRTSAVDSAGAASVSTFTLWDGLTPIQASNSVAGTTTMVADDAGLLLQGGEDSSAVWAVLDRLGSVVAQIGETDSSAAVRPAGTDRSARFSQVAQYGDYGTQRFGSSGWTGAAGFTGQPGSPAGLNLFFARGYEPATGSWLSADPYRPGAADPASLNRYAYVNGNPATLVDLLGFRPVDPFDGYGTNTPSLQRAMGAATTRLLGQARAWQAAGSPELHVPAASSRPTQRHEDWWNPFSWSGDTWQNIGAAVAGVATAVAVTAAVAGLVACTVATAGGCSVAAAVIGSAVAGAAGGAAGAAVNYGLSTGKKSAKGLSEAIGNGLITGAVGGAVFGDVSSAISSARAVGAAASRLPMQASRSVASQAESTATSSAGQAVGNVTATRSSSMYRDNTFRNSVRNIKTDVSHTEFQENLLKEGWTASPSDDLRVLNFTKDGARYGLREESDSYPGWTAEYTPKNAAKFTMKLRLGASD
ncbi:MAG TPA: DUF6531 domain-containing protein [Microbacteriaceae bacterium]|nr:DUF6531 domain-containing protein [Microbacteriaceae bacterium]